MKRFIAITFVLCIFFSSFVFAATPTNITAHCEDILDTYEVEGVEVTLPGFRNRIMNIQIQEEFYGQVVIEEKIVTEARCEPGHDPTIVGTVDSLATIDAILASDNPVDAYLSAVSNDQIVVQAIEGNIVTYRAAIFLARIGNFFGFFG